MDRRRGFDGAETLYPIQSERLREAKPETSVRRVVDERLDLAFCVMSFCWSICLAIFAVRVLVDLIERVAKWWR